MGANRIIYFFLISAVSLSLSGCGATNSLTLQERETIQSVAITQADVNFKKSEDFIYIATFGRTMSGMFGGIIGTLIYEANHDFTPEQLILMRLEKDDMLSETITDAFIYHLEGAGIFAQVIDDKKISDAHLEISLPVNFQIIEREDDKFKVTFRVDAKLLSRSGDIVWQDWAYFSAFNDQLVEYTLEDLLAKPETLQHAISITAQLVAQQFVQETGGTPKALDNELHLLN